MIDLVSIFTLGGLAGMTLTGAVMQIVSLNPARKLLNAAAARIERMERNNAVLAEEFDRVVEENETLGRDVMTLLAFKRKRNRSAGQRARDAAAARVLKVEKTAALRSYAQSHSPVAGLHY